MIGNVLKSVVIAGLVLGAVVVKAEHTAAAYDVENNYSGLGVGATVKRAEQNALEACSANKQGAKCEVTYTVAVSIAKSKEGKSYYGFSAKTKQEAEKLALDSCFVDSAKCEIDFTLRKPGLYAIFRAMKDDKTVGTHFLYESKNPTLLLKDAARECKEFFKMECNSWVVGAVKGELKPESTSTAKPLTAQQSCRPNTQSIRCSSQCTNGNCVVTYENGCKMRVLVQPKYDPFSNQWTYPAPSC